ncbi:MAG: Gfo/Idh/MocA family oxidoreductase [Bacteroidetes bacterium]|nr:Gfo/Idh/MocA family oxidoreductase [Bacteroidota bacterium]
MFSSEKFANLPIVVFGAGSIGERHIRNLWQLGFKNIVVFRQRNLPFRDIADAKVATIRTWEEVAKIKPFAAIIASPTSLHLEQSIKCINLKINILVEKPLSNTIENFDLLKNAVNNNQVFVYVGYMMRFHPLIQKLKQIIESHQYGDIISLQSKWAEYLPDWHPWEDYRTSYAAKKNLGGGVALTLSHEIDLCNYLANSNIKATFIQKSYKSKLEVDVESGADILIKYENDSTSNIHLNFYEKSKERFLRIVFDDASIIFDYFNSTLTIKTNYQEDIVITEKNFDRNDMFLEQTKYFFSKLNHFTLEESLQQVENSEQIIKICSNGI